MPVASGAGGKKYMWIDHDAMELYKNPPVQNTWYTAINEVDVRLLWCQFYQSNAEAAVKEIEMRWTIDGHVYFCAMNAASLTPYYVNKDEYNSTGGAAGLYVEDVTQNAGFYVDKRGHSFKVEIRIITAPGTTQHLYCYCVYETLEEV
jgi:hypothetical protein